MRTFIAIELPKEIKDYLTKLQDKLKTTGADVKWVASQNIHLTLKFLGEIDDKKLNKITKIIEDTANDKKSFQMRIASFGAFPKIDFPRVIWAGVDKGDKEIKEIAEELEEKIATVGIPKEDKPFSSHITIGRVKSGLNRDKLVKNLHYLADNFGQENLEFLVARITLLKSNLTAGGPIYEALKEASLKAT